MAINVNLSVDLDQITGFLDDFKKKALVNATRMSMNRTVASLRTFANKKAREFRKVKAGDLNRKYFSLKRASGGDLGRMEASLTISGRPMSLIDFVVGSKTPRDQAGIPVAARKRIKVEVKPGRKVTLQSAYIGRAKGGAYHVFRRLGSSAKGARSYTPSYKQSVPSLAVLFAKQEVRDEMESFARAKLGAEFEQAFTFEVQKIIERRRKR